MRPPIQKAREQLVSVLARLGPASASTLAGELGVSVATLHRMLPALGEQLLTAGSARSTRHALRRPLRGDLAGQPLYAIDEKGRASLLCRLALRHPQDSFMDLGGTQWPVPPESRTGWWEGLPYPLYDMRPQGYMGRQFARVQHRQFEVAPDPGDWSDDDIVYVLSRAGSDVSGNLVLGDMALERWMQTRLEAEAPLREAKLGPAYAELATNALASGLHGSSAAGDFPKFSARRELPRSRTPHVLVKFSGVDGSAAVRRWADLLVCEHLALECAALLPGLRSAPSRIVTHAGRTFLEVERFDRHGRYGRSPLVSLETVNAVFVGAGATAMGWPGMAHRLSQAALLSQEDAGRVERLWYFGQQIANSDMHQGNLSFRPDGLLKLAPVYDMSPMLYAPLPGGELPQPVFSPAPPLPQHRAAWEQAFAASDVFWTRAAADTRISREFRAIARANQRTLRRVAQI